MRLIFAILAILPTLVLGTVFGVALARPCEIDPRTSLVLSTPPQEACCCCCSDEPREEPTDERVGCCQGSPSPLNAILLCCMAPLGPLVPAAQVPFCEPTASDFVQPVWPFDAPADPAWHRMEFIRATRAGPPPDRSRLCVWVI